MIMEILNFVFQDFWHFLGTWLILGTIASIFRGIFTIQNIYPAKKEKDKE